MTVDRATVDGATGPTIALAHWPLEQFTDAELDRLAAAGRLVAREPITSWDDVDPAVLASIEVLVGHWGTPRLDAEALERLPRLRLLAYGAGTVKATITTDVLDRGIVVTSAAAANAEPVAEYTLAAILLANKDAFWRREQHSDPSVAGRRAARVRPIGNWNRRIGLVSASLVGRAVIRLLGAFPHLDVAVYDPYLDEDEARALGVTRMELDELCSWCDVLSLHAPALPATHHLVTRHHLALLADGTTVINTARGSVIDQEGLEAELVAGRLNAVLDVTDPEPLPEDSVLRDLPNAFCTPHLAGSEGDELRRMAELVITEVERHAAGLAPLHPVRAADFDILA